MMSLMAYEAPSKGQKEVYRVRSLTKGKDLVWVLRPRYLAA